MADLETQARFKQYFEVDDRQSRSALGRMGKDAGKASKEVDRVSGALKKLLGVAAGLASLKGLKSLANEATTAFHQLRTIKLAMGGSIEQADAMADAFADAGVEVNVLTAALSRYGIQQAQIRKYREENRELPVELKQWVTLGEKAMGSFPEALAVISEKMKGLRTEQEKFVYASQFFGRQTQRLLPVLSEGPEAIRNAWSGPFSGPFTTENAKIMEQMRRDLVLMERKWLHIKIYVAKEMLPVIQKIARDWMPMIKDASIAFGKGLGVAANNADLLAKSIKVAAVAWLSMKGYNLAKSLAAAAAASAMGTAAGTAAGAAAGGAAAGAAAGGGAVTAGAVLRHVLGKGAGWLRGAGRVAGRAAVPLALLTTAFDIKEAWAQEAELNAQSPGQSPFLRRAVASGLGRGKGAGFAGMLEQMERMRREQEAAAETARKAAEAERLKEEQTARAQKALEKFEKWTGFSAKALAALGLNVEEMGSKMARGMNSMIRAARKAMTTQAQQEGDKAALDIQITQGAAFYAGVGRKDPSFLARERERLTAIARTRTRRVHKLFEGGPRGGRFGEWVNEPVPAAERNKAREELRNITMAQAYLRRQRLQETAEGQRAILEGTAPQITNNYNGPITVNVDLRDEDPDRIMFSVLDDVARMSEHRTTSRMYPAFAGR